MFEHQSESAGDNLRKWAVSNFSVIVLGGTLFAEGSID